MWSGERRALRLTAGVLGERSPSCRIRAASFAKSFDSNCVAWTSIEGDLFAMGEAMMGEVKAANDKRYAASTDT